MLSKEEVLVEFAKTGLNAEYADVFAQKYVDEYETWIDYDNASDNAMKCVKNGFRWFALYKEIGYQELWCESAYSFGCSIVDIDISLDNEIVCMREIVEDLSYDSFETFQTTKEIEFNKHFCHIKKAYGKDDVFMRFYIEYVQDFGFNYDMLDTVSQQAFSYNYAISEGKSDDFAYFYATFCGYEAWRVAELREKLQMEGWDEDYVRLYVIKYAEGLAEDGEEREHPDIPAWWEEKVDAYMKGWDYARKNNYDDKFAERFQITYLNLSHPDDIPTFPFSEVEDRAVEETIKLYYGKSI